MDIILKIIILLVGSVAGVLMMRYNFELTRMVGHNYYAERYLGDGGTYTMWKLLGLITVVGSFWYVLT